MKHLAAYLLLGLGGNTSPSAKDVKSVLSAVGIEADDDRLEQLLSELKGKDVSEVCLTCASTISFLANSLELLVKQKKKFAGRRLTNIVSPSSLLLVPRSSLPSPLVVLVAPLLLVELPPAVLPPLTLPLRRRRKRKRSLMRTWVSVCSTKWFLSRGNSYGHGVPRISEKFWSGCAAALQCLFFSPK